jgi:hypothetical protein
MSWTHQQAAACCQQLGDIETILCDSKTSRLLVATVTIDGIRWHVAPTTSMAVAAVASDEIMGPITQNDKPIEDILKPVIDAEPKLFKKTTRAALEDWCVGSGWGVLVLQSAVQPDVQARIPLERRRLAVLIRALRTPIQDGDGEAVKEPGLESLWTVGPHPTVQTAVVVRASTVRGSAIGILQGLAPSANIPSVELVL